MGRGGGGEGVNKKVTWCFTPSGGGGGGSK